MKNTIKNLFLLKAMLLTGLLTFPIVNSYSQCQNIIAQFDSSNPPPVVNGIINSCQNQDITFNGSAIFQTSGVGATYEWFFGDGMSAMGTTVIHQYLTGGSYNVELVVTDTFGCTSNNDIAVLVQISTTPDFSGTTVVDPILCLGETAVLTANVVPVPFEVNCTIPVADVTFLPDGNGVSYETFIPVDCFPAGQVVTDITDILEICLNVEHSYLGDLDIDIIAPSGQSVRLHDQGGGSANLGKPWATGPVDMDSGNTTPGIGGDYCFMPVGGFPTMVAGILPGGFFINGDGPGTYEDTFVPDGSYAAIENWDNLIGADLNGNWTIRVTDNLGADNGYIFSWFINFNPDIIPDASSFEPVIVSEAWDPDPTIVSTMGAAITVLPTSLGNKCYTYRVVDDFGCTYTEQFCVDVFAQPIVANEPNDLFICDDGVNLGVFDLTENDDDVLGAQNAADFIITYHNTLADAIAGTAPIMTPAAYPIIGVLEEVFVRITDVSGNCSVTDSFFLNFQAAMAGPMTDVDICDDDSDGFVTVNLPALKNAEALMLQSPLLYSVTYHANLVDATNDLNSLPAVYTVNAPAETIFVRVENNITQTCFAIDNFTFNIFEVPTATIPTRYDICDELPNDGFAEFDLTTKNLEITGGNPDAVVAYFISLTAAQAGVFSITPANAFTNTVLGFQTVFARVDNINSTDCFNIVPLELRVNDSPAITSPIEDYFLCDNDGDGLEIFDLTTKEEEILNTLVDVTLTYHETQVEADAGFPEIIPATAYPSGNAVVWVRAVNYQDGDTSNPPLCVAVASFNLILGQSPLFTSLAEITTCDDGLADGISEFDLNSNNAVITGGNMGLTVTYYASLSDAESPINALPVFYTNTFNPEAIWVRVEDNATGCRSIFMSELRVVARPDVCAPDPIIFCDQDNDGFGTFDLNEATEAAVCGNPAGNLQVSYHLTMADANNNVLPLDLAATYDNEVPFDQLIYIRVNDIATGCYDITTVNLLVEESPQITDPDPLVVCDTDGDGLAVFNLTAVEPQLLFGLTGGPYVVTYFSDIAMTSAISNPIAFTNTTNPQVIFITVADVNNDCESETTLLLQVALPPVLINPIPLELCDQTDILGPDDEVEVFDLTQSIPEITGGVLGVSISFFETQADMASNINEILNPTTYQNLIGGIAQNPQTIWLRAEDTSSRCVVDDGMATLDLIVNPLPSPLEPEPLEACDINNDGFADFTLTDKDIEIIDNEPGVAITYHDTFGNAIAGTLALISPYTNTVANNQIIYARATYVGPAPDPATGCFRVVSLSLLVNSAPTIPLALDPIIACDIDMDGFEVFDLTDRADAIYAGQDPDYDLSYYTSLVNAQAGVPEIANPDTFTNTITPIQPIFVRLEEADTECFNIGMFDIMVVEVPIFFDPSPITTCDDEIADGIAEFDLNINNTTITGGDIGLTVRYYNSLADAEAPINALPELYTNTINLEDVWVRVEDNATGCHSIFMSQLFVIPLPELCEPDGLVFCDQDNDGFGAFDLNEATQSALCGNPLGMLQVSYHRTLADAENNEVPIDLTIAYNNTVPFDQEIFIRVLDPATGCFNITTLHLLVEESPQISDPDPLVVCDTDGDGLAVFNLTNAEDQILIGLTDSFDTSYFVDIAMTNEIVNPIAYSNISNPQTIYITVGDQNNDCESTTTLELQVALPAVLINPTPLELCDETDILGLDDSVEAFDLTQSIPEITGGALGIEITFFETQADMESNINVIEVPTAFQNLNATDDAAINPMTIWIRAEDTNSRCVVDDGSITLGLIVNPRPSPSEPEPLEACDIDNDGFTDFTLTDSDFEIIDNEPGVAITYHETESDAIAGVFALMSPYLNIVADNQIIYARATYVGPAPAPSTGCFRVVALTLLVNPTPTIAVVLDPIIACDSDMDGFEVFDLTQREGDILGSQSLDDLDLSYHTSLLDAQAGAADITNPGAFMNMTSPIQPIFVRLEDPDTACFKIGMFDIMVVAGPDVFDPGPFTQCDDLGAPNDGITAFDLTTRDSLITGIAPGIGVQYFESQADADNNENAINPSTAYINEISNPQAVFVRVTDGNTLCVDTSISFNLRVVPNPEPEQPEAIALCDTDGNGEEVFDLTIRSSQILDGESYGLDYYESELLAIVGDLIDAIPDPTMYTNTSNPQTIYVRVTNALTPEMCFEIVELVIRVDPLPDNTAVIDDFILCEIPFDGVAIFDLTTKIPEILVGQDMVNNEVSFYEGIGDANAGVNPIVIPTVYQNDGNPQEIFVGITNSITGCYQGEDISFFIEVREGATATAPFAPYVLCDLEGDNDGFTSFALSQLDIPELWDEILGIQSLLVHDLTFHETFENAADGTNAIGPSYTNIINPQVIYARVENIGTMCFAIAEVILKVEQLPVVVLEESYRLCIDAGGSPIPQEEGEESPPFIETGLDADFYTFEWRIDDVVVAGETGASITAVVGGNYEVTITELASGCRTDVPTIVTVSQAPTALSFILVNGAFANNHTVEVTAEGLGMYIYSIDSGAFQDSNVFMNVSPGMHTIAVKDANGCGESEFNIGVVDYPDYFTPNNDGVHDEWNIIGIADFDPTANIYIFDRYGKLLKQLSPLTPGWNGTYNGNPLPSSDYWFKVEYTEQEVRKEIKGHFTLKR